MVCYRIALAALALLPVALRAQDLVPKIEYQGGHAGMEKRVKGSLMISDSVLTFTNEKGAQLISIPLTQVKEVSSSVSQKDASTGAKLAFGFLAKSRKDELVTVSYETTQTAEGLVFKTEKNMSAGLVAKLQFHLKRAGVTTKP